MFRQAGEEWRLEASDGLAVLAAHRPLIMAALADVKYDKIVHVRQVRGSMQGLHTHAVPVSPHVRVACCLSPGGHACRGNTLHKGLLLRGAPEPMSASL